MQRSTILAGALAAILAVAEAPVVAVGNSIDNDPSNIVLAAVATACDKAESDEALRNLENTILAICQDHLRAIGAIQNINSWMKNAGLQWKGNEPDTWATAIGHIIDSLEPVSQ